MEKVRRKADAQRRKKDFFLAQSLLVLAALTVGAIDSQKGSLDAIVAFGAVAFGLAVCTHMLDPFAFYDRLSQSIFVVIDTALVFAILLAAGVGRSVSIPFFLSLMAAALLEQGFLLASATVVLAALSVFLGQSPVFNPASAVARPVLMMATALFYWLVVTIERGDEIRRASTD